MLLSSRPLNCAVARALAATFEVIVRVEVSFPSLPSIAVAIEFVFKMFAVPSSIPKALATASIVKPFSEAVAKSASVHPIASALVPIVISLSSLCEVASASIFRVAP